MRRRLLVAAVLSLLLPLTGCANDFSAGLAATDSCRAAQLVTTTPGDDVEAIAQATLAFADTLPEALRPAAQLLAVPADSGGDAVAQRQARLVALVDLQTWVLETCGSYLTIGAPRDTETTVAEARLTDFETVVGRSDGEVYISVLGVTDETVALALCGQVLAVHAAPGTVVHIQVLDPFGQALAGSTESACQSATP